MSIGLLRIRRRGIGLPWDLRNHELRGRTRTAEIGVRIALGARSVDVMRLVMGRSLILVAGGIAIGLGMALLLTRLIESLLYGVRPGDTVTLVAVVATLFVVTALAAYWPAQRLATLDPTKLLKSE